MTDTVDLDSLVVPTLEQMNQMRFDCDYFACKEAAQQWADLCGHPLVICHQMVTPADLIKYQLIVRHIGGEAVFIKSTGINPIGSVETEFLLWLDEVHKYEAGRDM